MAGKLFNNNGSGNLSFEVSDGLKDIQIEDDLDDEKVFIEAVETDSSIVHSHQIECEAIGTQNSSDSPDSNNE